MALGFWGIVLVVVTILLVLSCIGVFIAPEANRPYFHSGNSVLFVIALCILEYIVLGGGGK